MATSIVFSRTNGFTKAPTVVFVKAGVVIKTLVGDDMVAIASNVEKYASSTRGSIASDHTPGQNWTFLFLWAGIVFWYHTLQRYINSVRIHLLPALWRPFSVAREANGQHGTTRQIQPQAEDNVAPTHPNSPPDSLPDIVAPSQPNQLPQINLPDGPGLLPVHRSSQEQLPSPAQGSSLSLRPTIPSSSKLSTLSGPTDRSGPPSQPESYAPSDASEITRPCSPSQSEAPSGAAPGSYRSSDVNPTPEHLPNTIKGLSPPPDHSAARRSSSLRGLSSLRTSPTLRKIKSALAPPAPDSESIGPGAPTLSLSAQALDAIWNSSALQDADSSWLPQQYAIDDALEKLLGTFMKPSTPVPKPSLLSKSPKPKEKLDFQSLMIYCPLEGGQPVIDATVKELARRTAAQTLVIDPAHIAAGRWGAFGDAAAGLERQYKLPYGTTTQERLASSKLKAEESKSAGRRPCPWCKERAQPHEHPFCRLRFLFQLISSSTPSHLGPTSSDVTCVSGHCPRIVYVRDIGLAHSWASDLIEALHAAILKVYHTYTPDCPFGSTSIALIYGYAPALSPASKPPKPASRRRRRRNWFFDDSTSDSSNGDENESAVKGWGEGEDADSQRDSRNLERIKQWRDDLLVQNVLLPLGLDVSLFGSIPSSADSGGKHGYLRCSVVIPRNRDKPKERVSREQRRFQLNTLRVNLAIAAAGAALESGVPAFSAASEVLSNTWATELVESRILSQVVDRILAPNLIDTGVHKAGNQVSWNGFTKAWEAHHQFETNEASCIRAEIKENSFDEVFLRVKSMDLSEHERQLLPCVVNPDQITTTFETVHLPIETIDRIRSLVSLPLLHPQVFQSGILKQHSMTGALLFGPPGTGKTHIARAVAKESGARMIALKPSDVQQMYVGESEKVVTAVFQLARRLMPCLIFIDEIDALFGARTNQGDSNSARYHASLITQFMQEMDGLLASKVVVVGATNRPFDLDDAILRRLPCRVLVDLPNRKARERILRTMLQDELLAPDVTCEDLAMKTEHYSGSDLKHLCVSAVLAAVKDQVKLPWKSAEKTQIHPSGTLSSSLLAKDTVKFPSSDQENLLDSPANSSKFHQNTSRNSIQLQAPIVQEAAPQSVTENPPTPRSHAGTDTINDPALGTETHQQKGDTPSQRIVCYRHFAHALAEVRPSTSEASMSVGLLRKWNKKLGAGGSTKQGQSPVQSQYSQSDIMMQDPSNLSDTGSRDGSQSDVWAPNFKGGKKPRRNWADSSRSS